MSVAHLPQYLGATVQPMPAQGGLFTESEANLHTYRDAPHRCRSATAHKSSGGGDGSCSDPCLAGWKANSPAKTAWTTWKPLFVTIGFRPARGIGRRQRNAWLASGGAMWTPLSPPTRPPAATGIGRA